MWTGLSMALSSVNLAEAAGNALPRETLSEVYATAAVAMKLGLAKKMQFMAVSLAMKHLM